MVRYGETPETSFNQWAWNLILRLKLHKNDYGMQQNCPTVPFSSTVPDMTDSPTFHPLLKAVKMGMPIGCYLALAMTAVGHRYIVWAEPLGLLNLVLCDLIFHMPRSEASIKSVEGESEPNHKPRLIAL